MKNKCTRIVSVCLVLSTLFFIGCESKPVSNATNGTYKVDKPVWKKWEATGEYAEYANLLACFSDPTKYTTII